MTEDRVMRMLGWFSAGLGVPQVSASGRFAKAIGVGDGSRQRAVTVFVGVRELAAAVGLLWQGNPGWLWGRVAGDLMDLGMLSRALKNHEGKGISRTIAAAAAVVGITGVDMYAAITRMGRKSMVNLTATTTITRSRQEVYDQWRHLDQLPTFMTHLDSVSMTGQRTSHWRASAPFGKTVEWDAEITEDVPGERIAWRSINGALVRSEGEVRFTSAPTEKDTEVHVRMRYLMPAGKVGESVARYFGEDPHQALGDDLRRFKQVAETGEVVRSEGAPGGKRARREFPQHPARPLSRDELAEVRV
jgi:uncharacterized membrane protein